MQSVNASRFCTSPSCEIVLFVLAAGNFEEWTSRNAAEPSKRVACGQLGCFTPTRSRMRGSGLETGEIRRLVGIISFTMCAGSRPDCSWFGVEVVDAKSKKLR